MSGRGAAGEKYAMSIAASVALAGAVAVQRTCAWTEPGANRYTGDPVAAVDHYAHIPPAIRDRLKQRLAVHAYDDIVTVTRDGIEGQHDYEPGIAGMHFGRNKVCRSVSRQRWPAERRVIGLVYCEQHYCMMVPTVCGNLSLISRRAGDEPLDINPSAGPPPEGGVPGAALPAGRAFQTPPLAAAVPAPALRPALAIPGAVEPPRIPAPVVAPNPYWPWPVWPVFPLIPSPPVITPPSPPPPAIPEPSGLWLGVSGAAAAWAWARRQRRQ